MNRRIWLRHGNEPEEVEFMPVEETVFPEEEAIQTMLHDNPDLIPVEDFGLSRLMVVTRETGFGSGYPDLIAVTIFGEIVIVEFKNRGNAQARREVIGQLLDYGACLWKTIANYGEFDVKVFRAYAASEYCKQDEIKAMSLEDAFRKFFCNGGTEDSGSPDGETAADADFAKFKANLEANLKAGRFVYVVVCPEIPNEAKCIIEYMARCLDARFYGVELDYFKDEGQGLEILFPRSIAYSAPTGTTAPLLLEDINRWLSERGPGYLEAFSRFTEEVKSLGGHLKIYSSGVGAYLPFGSGKDAKGALLWVDIGSARRPIHAFSGGQFEFYTKSRSDLDWFTEETANVYRERLQNEFPDLADTLDSKRKLGAPATIEDAEAFDKFLRFAIQFYKDCVAAKQGGAGITRKAQQ